MVISKRQYYCNFLIAMLVMGMLLSISIPIANHFLLDIQIINELCMKAFIIESIMIFAVIIIILLKNKGAKNFINRYQLLKCIENNLISVGAYSKQNNMIYVKLPKIKISENKIIISLKNLKIRSVLEKYLDSFSTALPDRYIVEDYFITPNSAEVIIIYENMKKYKPEQYMLTEYVKVIKSLDKHNFYFDKKHIVSTKEYPHFLISGATGSGKTYFANQLVIQAIIKGWEVIILDLKRSYGLYKDFTDYCYELDDILEKLQSVESLMSIRMKELQPELDKNPNVLYEKPMLVVIEEYISLQASFEKKKKDELERIVKNLSVLSRQSNIHLMIVMQSAGTENINATTRSNLTKVLLGNAQSNILTATFGVGVDIPYSNTKMVKGEGLIQLDRITKLRVPKINDIENLKDVFC